ncbi:MAG: serine/threonine-protein kinase [Kiritimatiellaeota bacterium]|nr:serine/threonine-protein kinase [Kiritimatiellota bacterium]
MATEKKIALPEFDVPDRRSGAATVMMTEPAQDPGVKHLCGHYKAIVEANAIFYPVAYRFPRELGRGRQGIVFLGLRQGARGCVTRHAIKLFDPSIYPTTEKYWTDMGRIAAQTSKLQLVTNPSLVAPDVYEENNGIGYLQMEVVDGVSLRYLLDGEHLNLVKARSTKEEWARFTDVIFRFERGRVRIQPGVALYIMRQALRGIEALHDAGFIHSDIKPANIMIDRQGYVRLIDYGRAVVINERVTILFGTPLYMAPEIHRREASMIQSDIYAVGLVGLEMLRGDTGIKPDLDEAALLEAKEKLPGRLLTLLPEYVRQNAQFVVLLQRFLDSEPRRRYANAREAEVGSEGLLQVHRQLVQLGKDAEYGRELEAYLAKLPFPISEGEQHNHRKSTKTATT